jgi:beta-glucanase (GH16 family)
MWNLRLSVCLFITSLLSACSNGGGGDNNAPQNEPDSSGGNWRLVWSDEFDQPQLDSSRWSYEENCWGGGNNELQCYVNDPDNVFIQNDMLHIKAIAEQVSGDAGQNGNSGNIVTRDYSSGRIRTLNKGDWKYGRFEIRALLPYGQGIWPAIWMLPTDWVYGGWAASGEIDIMEVINQRTGGAEDNLVHGTIHFGGTAPNNALRGNTRRPTTDITTTFHTYTVEWAQGEIRWYINNSRYATLTESHWYTDGNAANETSAAPFDQHFHLLLNVAVGGNWPGNPNGSTAFPQEMVIDYVRVYECSANPQTGRCCATR